MRPRLLPVAVVAAGCLLLAGSGSANTSAGWLLPNLDLASTRALQASGIDRSNVGTLHVAWRFRFRAPPGDSGSFTATPIVAGGIVYVEDMLSNVWALDLATGHIRWRHLFNATAQGPNGLAVAGGRVFGTTDSGAFALDARTGRTLWRRFLVTAQARFVETAPQAADGLVYLSTIGIPPNGRGILYALDARTGKIRWQLDTIKGPWAHPYLAGGGGAWYPPSLAAHRLYWGTANPYPYGGSRALPNGAAFKGPAFYTDSLLALIPRTGHLAWYDQVTPHDVRDYDFQLPPIVGNAGKRPAVFGAGKAGRVIAWDRESHKRLWETEVGIHRNDRGSLPRRPVEVCPGLLGGVETPMASADGRLFVPVVDLCMRGSSTGYEPLARVDVAGRGRGELVALDTATGKVAWTVHLPQPDFGCATAAEGVVFTTTYDGTVLGLSTADGSVLWRSTLRAGVNACPALARGWLLVGAGVSRGHGSVRELTSFRLAR